MKSTTPLNLSRDTAKEDLALILGDRGGINNRRNVLPSFSTTKWDDVATQTGLPPNANSLALETPIYQLPPSSHKAIFEALAYMCTKRKDFREESKLDYVT